jgi:hypothetical protein
VRFRYSLQTLLIFVLLWSAGLGTWSYFRQAPPRRGPVIAVGQTYVGLVFPPGTRIYEMVTAWEPSARDVERAENRIAEFLRSKNPHLAARLGDYVRQYYGVVRTGRRMIYCTFRGRWSAIVDPPGRGDAYLRDIGTPEMVVDGGEDFFQLLYDVEADRCSGLHVNATS